MEIKNRYKNVCPVMPDLQALPLCGSMNNRIQGLTAYIIDFGVYQIC
ncbi:MAG: hypothetical protein JW927_21300 [Deltaproteobacteria bacterium]|nr:hypothetical protein [Deltaproteobacteria bacterium]